MGLIIGPISGFLGTFFNLSNFCLIIFDFQELEKMEMWMTMKETYKYCNAFALAVIGRATDAGELLDCNGEAFTGVKELVNELLRVETLKNKPKLVNIRACLDGNY